MFKNIATVSLIEIKKKATGISIYREYIAPIATLTEILQEFNAQKGCVTPALLLGATDN